jgi:hypothetical protein
MIAPVCSMISIDQSHSTMLNGGKFLLVEEIGVSTKIFFFKHSNLEKDNFFNSHFHLDFQNIFLT